MAKIIYTATVTGFVCSDMLIPTQYDLVLIKEVKESGLDNVKHNLRHNQPYIVHTSI